MSSRNCWSHLRPLTRRKHGKDNSVTALWPARFLHGASRGVQDTQFTHRPMRFYISEQKYDEYYPP